MPLFQYRAIDAAQRMEGPDGDSQVGTVKVNHLVRISHFVACWLHAPIGATADRESLQHAERGLGWSPRRNDVGRELYREEDVLYVFEISTVDQ